MFSRGKCTALLAVVAAGVACAQVNPFYSNFDADPIGDNAPAGFTEFGGGVTGSTGGINVVSTGQNHLYNFDASMTVSLSGTAGDGYGMGLRRQSFVNPAQTYGSFRTSVDFHYTTAYINSNTQSYSGTMAGLTAFIDPVTAYGYYLAFVFDPVSYDTFAGAASNMQIGTLRLFRYSGSGSTEVLSTTGITPHVGTTYHMTLDVVSTAGGAAFRGTVSDAAEDQAELEFTDFYPPMSGTGFGVYQQSQVFATVQPGSGYAASSANCVTQFDNFKIEAVPEPASMVALASGALALLRRKKR